jgi:hypothetical protein
VISEYVSRVLIIVPKITIYKSIQELFSLLRSQCGLERTAAHPLVGNEVDYTSKQRLAVTGKYNV